MGRILSNAVLAKELEVDYSSKTVGEARKLRLKNIEAFNNISRKGYSYNKAEKLILLYETLNNEKVYIQFPGKESIGTPQMALDFRPKIQLSTDEFIIDLSFGAIWDILDVIGKKYKAYLSYVASIFFRLGYMSNYVEHNEEYKCFELNTGTGELNEIKYEKLNWFGINLPEDVWFTLNDKIGLIELENGQKISFEGFIKLVDLLFQNEDCKYYYKNVVINKKENYKLDNGRINSSAANLLILNYLQGNVKISRLLDAFQQSRGVPSFRKSDYSNVTDGIVINIDIENR